VKDMFS